MLVLSERFELYEEFNGGEGGWRIGGDRSNNWGGDWQIEAVWVVWEETEGKG